MISKLQALVLSLKNPIAPRTLNGSPLRAACCNLGRGNGICGRLGKAPARKIDDNSPLGLVGWCRYDCSSRARTSACSSGRRRRGTSALGRWLLWHVLGFLLSRSLKQGKFVRPGLPLNSHTSRPWCLVRMPIQHPCSLVPFCHQARSGLASEYDPTCSRSQSCARTKTCRLASSSLAGLATLPNTRASSTDELAQTISSE
jgi:hypothetical protein